MKTEGGGGTSTIAAAFCRHGVQQQQQQLTSMLWCAQKTACTTNSSWIAFVSQRKLGDRPMQVGMPAQCHHNTPSPCDWLAAQQVL